MKETAIKFAEWISMNRYSICVNEEWIKIDDASYAVVAKNTADLYELFINNKIK